MSIASEICGAIREKIDDRPPLQYRKLPRGFRLGHQYHGPDVYLWREDQPEAVVLMGRESRDAYGTRWYLNPGWRNEVKALVGMLGMDEPETIEEEITW